MAGPKILSACSCKSKWMPVFFVVTIAVVIFVRKFSLQMDTPPFGWSQSAEQDLDLRFSKPPAVAEGSRSPTHDTKLILLTYMRSGSSFTGDLFNHHSQVFYFYEPLWTLDQHFKKRIPAIFFNRSPIKYSVNDSHVLPWMKRHLINASINCFFHDMHVQPLMVDRAIRLSKASIPFADCAEENPGLLGLSQCLPIMEKACSSAKVTIVKTVRLSMKQAGVFLRTDPKVKIMHLIRDPRGVLLSRSKTHIAEKYEMTPKQFCSHILQDLKDSIPLKDQFPGRIVTARYEDLAENPLTFAERLFKWAGLEREPALDQYIRKITSSNQTKGITIWNTVRRNSKTTASHWRHKIDFSFANKIDDSCSVLYRKMGYIRMANESLLRNLNKPYYRKWNQVSGLWEIDG